MRSGKIDPSITELRGTPESFGWVKRSDLRTLLNDVWELPDGELRKMRRGEKFKVVRQVVRDDA